MNSFNFVMRTLRKQKSDTLISVMSLVVGIACFILLMLYAQYELSYDSFHEKSHRIFLVGQVLPDWQFNGSNRFGSTSGALAAALKNEFPEVEYAARVKETNAPLLYEQTKSVLGKGLYVDNDFFNLFTFPIKAGDRKSALLNPFTIVLSEQMAETLFGSENPIGKVVTHEKGREYTVTGIVEDPPGNTLLRFDYLLSFQTMYSIRNDIETSWSILNYSTYLSLHEHVVPAEFEKKLAALVEKYHSKRDKNRHYYLTPVTALHFETNLNSLSLRPIEKSDIYLLPSIAFLILIVACVNSINLATARAGARSKEIGIRKSLGADRSHLVWQFLGESFVYAFLSIMCSLFIVVLIFPYFQELTGNGIRLTILTSSTSVFGIIGLFFFVGLFSGIYPALVLSSLKPVNLLKSSFGSNLTGHQLNIRNILVVFQFCVTTVLVVWALVIQQQLYYIKHKDIGYTKENIVTLRLWDQQSRQQAQRIKEELLNNPNIISAALSNIPPIQKTECNDLKIINETGETVTVPMVTTYFIDYEYIDLFGMKILEGRNFSPEFSGDLDRQVIVNETTVRMAGLVHPIGKKILKWGSEFTIVGVVKDFHYTSFKTQVDPLLLSYAPQSTNTFFIKISGHNLQETLASIASTFRKFSPSFVYDYSFMDDLYLTMYKTEDDLGATTLSFSIITIIIAAIGLYGLISFVVGRKVKEIAVRKIVGASVASIVWFLSREFLLLIAISLLLSLPVAHYCASTWLSGFVYHATMNVWVFIAAALLLLVIAFSSIIQKTLTAARANPVESLKYE